MIKEHSFNIHTTSSFVTYDVYYSITCYGKVDDEDDSLMLFVICEYGYMWS